MANRIRIAATAQYRKEAPALAVIGPGMILERSAATFTPHATDGSRPNLILVAEENALEGEDLDTSYAIGDRVYARVYHEGDEFYARLEAGEIVALNGGLISTGTGDLRAVTSGETPNFMAREAADNSATGTTTKAWLHVEVLGN